MRRKVCRSLLADSRALRELVAGLPRCNQHRECPRVATFEWYGEEYACDLHCPLERGHNEELPYAAVIRRLGV